MITLGNKAGHLAAKVVSKAPRKLRSPSSEPEEAAVVSATNGPVTVQVKSMQVKSQSKMSNTSMAVRKALPTRSMPGSNKADVQVKKAGQADSR